MIFSSWMAELVVGFIVVDEKAIRFYRHGFGHAAVLMDQVALGHLGVTSWHLPVLLMRDLYNQLCSMRSGSHTTSTPDMLKLSTRLALSRKANLQWDK